MTCNSLTFSTWRVCIVEYKVRCLYASKQLPVVFKKIKVLFPPKYHPKNLERHLNYKSNDWQCSIFSSLTTYWKLLPFLKVFDFFPWFLTIEYLVSLFNTKATSTLSLILSLASMLLASRTTNWRAWSWQCLKWACDSISVLAPTMLDVPSWH